MKCSTVSFDRGIELISARNRIQSISRKNCFTWKRMTMNTELSVEVGEQINSYMIADLPKHERPRERLIKRGSDSLSDAELLGIILRSGRKGRSTLDVARDLLQLFDHNLGRLAQATPTELTKVKGIGPAKAAELKATFALAQRLAEHIQPERPRIDSPAAAANYLRELVRGKQQEEMRCLLLDTKNRLIRDVLVTIGLLNRSQAHAREVFRAAVQEAAAKILIAHNHPSGDPSPSREDIQLTKQLKEAGTIIGIEVVDHIIMGDRCDGRDEDFVSLRELELL